MKKRLLCLSLALVSQGSLASPWIDAGDTQLKNSIDLLVSYGVIHHPVNQYPLMWQGIASDLVDIDRATLPQEVMFALQHVEHSLRVAKLKRDSGVRAYYSSDAKLTQGFAPRDKAKAGLDTYGLMTSENVSAKVQVNYQRDGLDGKTTNYDGSHLAVLFDNWAVSAERLSYWWGPSNDNAQLLSNHAPPMTGLRLTRASSQLGPSFLSFLGPWQVTAIAAQQRPSQPIANVKKNPSSNLWALRFAATPLPGLEIATSTLSSEFVFEYDRTLERETPKKQTLQSFDVKYSMLAGQIPFSIYGEWMGHNQSGLTPISPTFTAGFETFTATASSRSKYYIEYTDNEQNCSESRVSVGCNVDVVPKNQFTNRDWWLGSALPQQMSGWTLGYERFESSGQGYGAKLKRHSKEESDFSELELRYQRGLFNGLWRVSANYVRQENPQDTSSDTRFSSSWEYRF